jgi:Na+-translocating ferredoxin:NAD+ oxidoreductase subunit C
VPRTFKIGGIHPPDSKISASSPIEVLAIPEVAYIPVGQHIGAPATPVVAKGDRVKVGQLIAKASGFVSANVHSSVSGTVTGIENMVDVSGYPRPTIAIAVEGDEWEVSIDRTTTLVEDIHLSSQEIIKRVADMGIVGMGGAAFPTHIKLMVPEGKKVDVLIINGAECEPYLTADDRLMVEHGREILVGVKLLMKALNVDRAIIGIENNKREAIGDLSMLCEYQSGISVLPLKVKYPQGGEKQLVKAAINREIPSGGLPFDVGAVVQNVATAFATYEAVQKNKPLIDRVVTVTGDSVSRPSNFIARVGTPINQLLEAAGGLAEGDVKVISGGPMMGKALPTINSPVTKGTSGVLVMKEGMAMRPAVSECIRCAKCVSVCPMGLEPFLLNKLSVRNLYSELEGNRVTDCIECGSCAYTCPAGIPLLDYIRYDKGAVMQAMRLRKK